MDGLHGNPLRDHHGDDTAGGLEDITFSPRPDGAAGASLTQNPAYGKSPGSGPVSSSTERVVSLDDPNASKTLKGLVLGRHLLSIRRRLHRPDPCFWRLGYKPPERTSYERLRPPFGALRTGGPGLPIRGGCCSDRCPPRRGDMGHQLVECGPSTIRPRPTLPGAESERANPSSPTVETVVVLPRNSR